MASPPEKPAPNSPQKSGWSWFTSFEYDKENVKPSDARNVLLVVAALITAVTFQAGVNPPGGVWQDNENGHTAGRAIYGNHKAPFYVFLISNTLALSSSIFIIVLLTHRFPFHFEVYPLRPISKFNPSLFFAVLFYQSFVTSSIRRRSLVTTSEFTRFEQGRDPCAENGGDVRLRSGKVVVSRPHST